MAIVRNTAQTTRFSPRGVSHEMEQTSRARHFEADIPVAKAGYPTWPSRISNFGESDIQLREDGYPTRLGRIADIVASDTRINRS